MNQTQQQVGWCQGSAWPTAGRLLPELAHPFRVEHRTVGLAKPRHNPSWEVARGTCYLLRITDHVERIGFNQEYTMSEQTRHRAISTVFIVLGIIIPTVVFTMLGEQAVEETGDPSAGGGYGWGCMVFMPFTIGLGWFLGEVVFICTNRARANDVLFDFRRAAVEFSQNAVVGSAVILQDQAHSLCLPVKDDRVGHYKRIVVSLLLWVLVGILLGIGGFYAVVFTSDRQMLLLLPAGLGIAIAAYDVGLKRWRSYLAKKEGVLFDLRDSRAFAVSIEETSSAGKSKLVPDEPGIAIVNLEHNVLLVEAMRYQYILRGQDIVHIKRFEKRRLPGLNIHCKVGDADLKFTMFYITSNIVELAGKQSRRVDKLIDRLRPIVSYGVVDSS